jgi:superfamily I DNA/RNA helicase
VFSQLPNLPAEQRRLLKLFARLGEQDRESLLAFAEFLAERGEEKGSEHSKPTFDAKPKSIPRPREESVVAAIKRLSETYHMLDRSLLLNDTSSLMTAHIIKGREAPDVIDELEELFARHYQELLSNRE